MASYRVVYPDGSTQEQVGTSDPEIDDELVTSGGRHVVTRYVQRRERGAAPTVYVDPSPSGETRPQKLISLSPEDLVAR